MSQGCWVRNWSARCHLGQPVRGTNNRLCQVEKVCAWELLQGGQGGQAVATHDDRDRMQALP